MPRNVTSDFDGRWGIALDGKTVALENTLHVNTGDWDGCIAIGRIHMAKYTIQRNML